MPACLDPAPEASPSPEPTAAPQATATPPPYRHARGTRPPGRDPGRDGARASHPAAARRQPQRHRGAARRRALRPLYRLDEDMVPVPELAKAAAADQLGRQDLDHPHQGRRTLPQRQQADRRRRHLLAAHGGFAIVPAGPRACARRCAATWSATPSATRTTSSSRCRAARAVPGRGPGPLAHPLRGRRQGRHQGPHRRRRPPEGEPARQRSSPSIAEQTRRDVCLEADPPEGLPACATIAATWSRSSGGPRWTCRRSARTSTRPACSTRTPTWATCSIACWRWHRSSTARRRTRTPRRWACSTPPSSHSGAVPTSWCASRTTAPTF